MSKYYRLFLKLNSQGESPPSLSKIKVSFQWKPKQCSACQVFGHTDHSCPMQLVPANQDQFLEQAKNGSLSEPAANNQAFASSSSVWRIVSKKGRSRVMSKQSVHVSSPQAPELSTTAVEVPSSSSLPSDGPTPNPLEIPLEKVIHQPLDQKSPSGAIIQDVELARLSKASSISDSLSESLAPPSLGFVTSTSSATISYQAWESLRNVSSARSALTSDQNRVSLGTSESVSLPSILGHPALLNRLISSAPSFAIHLQNKEALSGTKEDYGSATSTSSLPAPKNSYGLMQGLDIGFS